VIAGFQIHEQQKVPEKILVEKKTRGRWQGSWNITNPKQCIMKWKYDSNLPYTCICLVVSTHLISQHGNLPQSFGMNIEKMNWVATNTSSHQVSSPHKKGSHWIWPNGIIFHQPSDFPEIFGDISRNLNQLPFFSGPKTRVLVTIIWPDFSWS